MANSIGINSRANAFAVTKEVTEGTPVFPSAGTDFLAPQDDLTLEASFETLENAEVKNSLGQAKSILGAQAPTASLSHYLRHSGVEGQAPNFGCLLEAALGEENTAVERDSISQSLTDGVASGIGVDVGEGVEFPLGRPMLLKDATNGYSIRFSDGATGDDVDLNFHLKTTHTTGSDLGTPVWYSPRNDCHPTLTLTQYIGNVASGAIQQIAGARVTSSSFTFDAGELINGSYSLEGVSFRYDPIEIGANDVALDFTDDGGTFAASIAEGIYKDPYDLAAAIETSMNAVQTAETHRVTYDDKTGKYSISSETSTVLSLLWNTGTNTAQTVGDVLGFIIVSDDTGATSYEADSAQDWSSGITPTFDSSDPLAAKCNLLMIGDAADNECIAASSVSISIDTPKRNIESICAESGIAGSVAQSRAVTASVSAVLEGYQAEEFRKFCTNQEVKMQYAFGVKEGGNWVPGKSGGIYMPTATITSFSVESDDGLAVLNMDLTAFVDDSGNGEVFIGFL